MGILSELGFGRVERKVRVVKAKRTYRSSLLDYLDKEIVKATNSNLVLISHSVKGDTTRKVKEIRMWGDVVDGKRRMTLKGMNKKLFQSYNDAEDGKDYTFSSIDAKGVISEMKRLRDTINEIEEGSLTFYYVSKKKGEKKQIIEVKV